MGDCSIRVTPDIYGHLIPSADVNAVDRLTPKRLRKNPQPRRNLDHAVGPENRRNSLKGVVDREGFEPSTS